MNGNSNLIVLHNNMAAERPKSGFQAIADAIGPDIHVNVFDPDGELNVLGFAQLMAQVERGHARFGQAQQKKRRTAKVVQDPRDSLWWKLYVLDSKGVYRLGHGKEGSFEFSCLIKCFSQSSIFWIVLNHDATSHEHFCFTCRFDVYFQLGFSADVFVCRGKCSMTW